MLNIILLVVAIASLPMWFKWLLISPDGPPSAIGQNERVTFQQAPNC